ncbi:hypothetical protein BC826DRAFT_654561 [Russula brevipes]|nr:hypothetical protein BC826DRAFT_654561 [Russula brevipes]
MEFNSPFEAVSKTRLHALPSSHHIREVTMLLFSFSLHTKDGFPWVSIVLARSVSSVMQSSPRLGRPITPICGTYAVLLINFVTAYHQVTFFPCLYMKDTALLPRLLSQPGTRLTHSSLIPYSGCLGHVHISVNPQVHTGRRLRSGLSVITSI